jgi:hypothetical protein
MDRPYVRDVSIANMILRCPGKLVTLDANDTLASRRNTSNRHNGSKWTQRTQGVNDDE